MASKTRDSVPSREPDVTELRRVMEQQGRRHVWLAELAGVSSSHVTRVMSGERQPGSDFKRVAAEALGVPEDELFPIEKAVA